MSYKLTSALARSTGPNVQNQSMALQVSSLLASYSRCLWVHCLSVKSSLTGKWFVSEVLGLAFLAWSFFFFFLLAIPRTRVATAVILSFDDGRFWILFSPHHQSQHLQSPSTSFLVREAWQSRRQFSTKEITNRMELGSSIEKISHK